MRICWAHLVYNQHSVSRVMQCMFLTFFMHSPYSSLSVEFSISLRPRASLVVQRVKNLPAATWEMQVRSWDRMIPWRRAWQPTPVLLPGEFMDRGAWRATVHGVTESQTQLSDFHFQLLLGKKAMTNLDSILKNKDITLQQRSVWSKLWFFQ